MLADLICTKKNQPKKPKTQPKQKNPKSYHQQAISLMLKSAGYLQSPASKLLAEIIHN